MTDDTEDLLWHGRRLCSALHRAWEAERRVRELEAAAREAVRALEPPTCAVDADEARLCLLAVLEPTTMPQDEPEPDHTT